MKASVAVTAVSGFIGGALLSELVARKFCVHQVPRSFAEIAGAQCVIHCAARTHVMHDEALDPLTEYRRVNVQGTLNLAKSAAAAGVNRFVFLSTVKVNGEQTTDCAFTSGAAEAPEDPYGVSKWEAEQGLWEISDQTGMEVVVVRPPLVYGPGVKGNFARLLRLVRSEVPLPFAAVKNRRSFIGLDNLVDLLIRCVGHPAAAGQTFLVSDSEDLSTPDTLRHMAAAMGRSARLFPVPVSLLLLAGSALGKRAEIDRLVGSLQVDSSHARQVLGWTPPVGVQEGIRRMVQGA